MKLLSVKKLNENPVVLEITYKTGWWFWEQTKTKQVFDKYPNSTRSNILNEYWEFMDGTERIYSGLSDLNSQLSTINKIIKVGETYFVDSINNVNKII
jgi:hypothetical protein